MQHGLFHVKLPVFKEGIPRDSWKEKQKVEHSLSNRKSFHPNLQTCLYRHKQKQKMKYSLSQRKPFKLNLQACMTDTCPDWPKQEHKHKQKELLHLPILVQNRGVCLQYAWDGQRLLLVKDSRRHHTKSLRQFLKDHVKRLRSVVMTLFVPQQVQSNYTYYLKWKFVHRIFSSAIQFQATQAMLQAIGIGAKRSLTSTATLNWVLKDGLGRLSKFIYTAILGPAFDADLKRVRFSTSVLFSLSVGVELLTPVFPRKFLLLASMANIAKSISMAAYVATSSAIHQSFAVADNLGDVSAKSQIQTVCFDNIGLALAACLNLLCKNNPRMESALPFIIYPVFSAIDLFAIYQGLKYIHLSTLNKARLEIIADKWIHSTTVPTTAEVSTAEGTQLFGASGSRQWPVRIGFVNLREQKPEVMVYIMESLRNGNRYFLCMESCYGFIRKPKMGLLLCLHENAVAADIVKGMLQASYMRVALTSKENNLSNSCNGRAISKPEAMLPRDWQNLLEESKSFANVEISQLLEQMEKAGWVLKNVLLSPSEQITYSTLVENENPQP